MKVKRITYAGKADVYNMEVDGTHNYVVNGGFVAHNCYDECRYVLMESPISPPAPRQIELPQFDPLKSEQVHVFRM